MFKRVQLDLDVRKVQELDGLMRECGLSTRKEFFNYAYAILKWALSERKKGNMIASVNDKEIYRELVMPIFDTIGSNAEQATVDKVTLPKKQKKMPDIETNQTAAKG